MKTYMIRTCDQDMTSFKGTFTWPESGPVACPDWDPMPHCGNGLHGLLLGCGDGDLLNWSKEAKWLLVEIDREDIVDLGGKVKVPRGTVVFCGTREEAIAKLEALAPETMAMPVVGATRTAGIEGIAMAGYRGTATAGREATAIAGFGGAATVGSYGTAIAGEEGTATAGFDGHATAGDNGKAIAEIKGTAIAGDEGTAIADDYGSATAGDWGHATAGKYGHATAGHDGTAIAGEGGTAIAGARGKATAGDGGSATAGVRGTAQVGWKGEILIKWPDSRYNRMRTVTGYAGEDGIEANKPYRVDLATGKLFLAE